MKRSHFIWISLAVLLLGTISPIFSQTYMTQSFVFPLKEISNALQGTNERVSVRLLKYSKLLLDLGSFIPQEMPAMKAVPAAQISSRDLLTEGSGYVLKIVGAGGQTLAEAPIVLKFE